MNLIQYWHCPQCQMTFKLDATRAYKAPEHAFIMVTHCVPCDRQDNRSSSEDPIEFYDKAGMFISRFDTFALYINWAQGLSGVK